MNSDPVILHKVSTMGEDEGKRVVYLDLIQGVTDTYVTIHLNPEDALQLANLITGLCTEVPIE